MILAVIALLATATFPPAAQAVDQMTWTQTNEAIEAIVSAQKPYRDDSKADALGEGKVTVKNFHWWPSGRYFFYSKDRADLSTGAADAGQIFSGPLRALDAETIEVKDLGNGGWQLTIHSKPPSVLPLDWKVTGLDKGPTWSDSRTADLTIPDFGSKEDASRVGDLIKHLVEMDSRGDSLRQQPQYNEAVAYFCGVVAKSENIHHDRPTNAYTLLGASARIENGILTITRRIRGDQPDANGNTVEHTQTQVVKLTDLAFDKPFVIVQSSPWLRCSCRMENRHPGSFAQSNWDGSANASHGNDVLVEFASEDSARIAARALSLAIQLYTPPAGEPVSPPAPPVVPPVSQKTEQALPAVESLSWTQTNEAIEGIVSSQKPYQADSKASALGGDKVTIRNFHWWPSGKWFYYSKERFEPASLSSEDETLWGSFSNLDSGAIDVKELRTSLWGLTLHCKGGAQVSIVDSQISRNGPDPWTWTRTFGADLTIPDFRSKEDAARVGDLIRHLIDLDAKGEGQLQQPDFKGAVTFFCNLAEVVNLHTGPDGQGRTMLGQTAGIENGVLKISSSDKYDQLDNGVENRSAEHITVKLMDLAPDSLVVNGSQLMMQCRSQKGHAGQFVRNNTILNNVAGYSNDTFNTDWISMSFAREADARSAARALSLAIQLYKP